MLLSCINCNAVRRAVYSVRDALVRGGNMCGGSEEFCFAKVE